MVKVGVIGNGRLGSVIVEAIQNGLVPECELVGVASRSSGFSVEELISLKPEYVIEAATQDVLRMYLLDMLKNGINVIPLSAGVLEDDVFRKNVENTAAEYKVKVILPHGALGGFDVASTFSLCEGMKGMIIQAGNSQRLGDGNTIKTTPINVRDAFEENPLHLNCIIEAGIVCGLAQTDYRKEITDNMNGYWTLQIENDYATAEIRIQSRDKASSRTLMMIALSAVSTLKRAVSPISF